MKFIDSGRAGRHTQIIIFDMNRIFPSGICGGAKG